MCREHTERGEGLGVFSFLVSHKTLEETFEKLINDHIPTGECPYGDGHSSNKILDILVKSDV